MYLCMYLHMRIAGANTVVAGYGKYPTLVFTGYSNMFPSFLLASYVYLGTFGTKTPQVTGATVAVHSM